MKYFGIVTIDNPPNIGWIEESEHDSWLSFFRHTVHAVLIKEAIRAYEAIGYRCVELDVAVKKEGTPDAQ